MTIAINNSGEVGGAGDEESRDPVDGGWEVIDGKGHVVNIKGYVLRRQTSKLSNEASHVHGEFH